MFWKWCGDLERQNSSVGDLEQSLRRDFAGDFLAGVSAEKIENGIIFDLLYNVDSALRKFWTQN
jgi:hypothetical protein